jgi:uncharacterized protein HemX
MNTVKAMRGELLIVAAIVLGLVGYAHCQSQVQMSTTIIMTDHARRAAPVNMAAPQSLLEPNAVTFAHGELPNSDIPRKAAPAQEPLGTVARRYRKERAFVFGLLTGILASHVYELQGGRP